MSEATAPGFASRYGPWALVLGGSEGIGEAFAHQVAAEGVNLVLVARREEPLLRTADAVRAGAPGVDVRTAAIDLTADDMLDRITAVTGDLDVGLVVYNAGATHGVPRFLDGPVEERLALVALNCVGPVQVAHHFGARMVERGRGGMIFLTSMAAVCGAARTATYSATKAFDLVLAEGLWAELAPQGVDVLALVAGATRTPAMARSGAHIGTEEFPGMDPDEVAREGLTNLTHGPTWIAGEGNRGAYELLRALPRAEVVNLMSQAVRTLYELSDDA